MQPPFDCPTQDQLAAKLKELLAAHTQAVHRLARVYGYLEAEKRAQPDFDLCELTREASNCMKRSTAARSQQRCS
jgi:hypothetical protein